MNARTTTLKELKQEAKAVGIRGYSRMDRERLLDRLNQGKMITKAGLKARGWTDRAITKFLGEPDQTRPNPHYSSAAPMNLYRLSRVELAENSKEFVSFRETKRKRSPKLLREQARQRRQAAFTARWPDWREASPGGLQPAVQPESVRKALNVLGRKPR